jgi:hypothetical protein
MRAVPVLLCLCACAAGRAPAPPQPTTPPASEPAAPEPVTPAAAASPELYELDPTRTLTADDILLQHAYEAGMLAPIAGDTQQAFGRVPSFTLYRDGIAVFVERTDNGHALRMWRMPEHEARDHIEHVRALGVARLRGYSHHCLRTGHYSRCISDAGVRVLRARLPDGTLRELRNYAGFAPRLTEQLHAIYDRITAIEAHYQGSALYLPRGATLFVVPLEREVADLAPESRARMRPWPLDDETLQRALAAKKVALEVPQIRVMIAATGSNIVRDQLFVHGGRLVHASMIPWLPDADHREAIARATGGR